MKFIEKYLNEVKEIADALNKNDLMDFILKIKMLKNRNGRLFIFGVGGSAANASHAVNDFRKICNIEAYAASDNFSEISARINDDGWDDSFKEWLKVSNFSKNDAIMIFSVGGGSDTTSKNLVEVMKYAKEIGGYIFSIVSRDGGYAKKLSNSCILIPVLNDNTITPHAEEWQAVLWHMITTYIKIEEQMEKFK